MIEGPGHIPMDQIEMQVEKEKELCYEAPFYTLGPLVTDIAPGLRPHHLGHRRGHDRLVRRVHAVLRDAEGAPGAAQPRGREGRASSPTRSRRTPPTSRATGRARATATTSFRRARYRFDWNRQFELSLDPETARAMHDETLPDEGFKDAHFCSMCGPKFCSMNISAKVESFTEADADAVLNGHAATGRWSRSPATTDTSRPSPHTGRDV